MRPDAIVVGAGAAGASAAYHLAAAGLRVLVLDPDPGRAAARAAAGILSRLQELEAGPEPVSERSIALWPALAERLKEETGIDPRLRRTGQLVLRPGFPEGWSRRAGRGESVDVQGVRALAPGLAEPPEEGLYGPDELTVHGESAVNALLEGARRRGAVLERRAVLAVRDGPSVVTAAGRVDAAAVVVCVGAWAARLGLRLNVRPARGQTVLLEAPARPVECVVDFGGEYYMPRAEHLPRRVVLAGTTTERGRWRAAPTKEGVAGLVERAGRRFPGLTGAPLAGASAGLRPESAEPFLGPVPRRPGVWAAGGAFRQGLILAPWMGQTSAGWVRAASRASTAPAAAAASAPAP